MDDCSKPFTLMESIQKGMEGLIQDAEFSPKQEIQLEDTSNISSVELPSPDISIETENHSEIPSSWTEEYSCGAEDNQGILYLYNLSVPPMKFQCCTISQFLPLYSSTMHSTLTTLPTIHTS